MRRALISGFLWIGIIAQAVASEAVKPDVPDAEKSAAFPGEKTEWFGYDHYAFTHEGRSCRVVVPATVAPGTPWIWRARFFGHEPQTDRALLARGYHVAYIDVAGLYGSPRAVALWDSFHAYLTEQHGFAPKAALEGMSRGGLIVYNWAKKNPAKVCAIYADAPVCDIKSWPGPKGWGECLKAYGLTPQEAMTFEGNPIDGLEPLAAAGVPLLHVCGDADTVVPYTENTAVLEKRYRALGGQISVILKPGVGHHPHSLKDPAPIVDFIEKSWRSREFQCHRLVDADGALTYRLLVPHGQDSSKRYPLVLFLHGAGERGDDNVAHLVHVVPILAEAENRRRFPCFVVAPQCPTGAQWVDTPWSADAHTLPETPSKPMALVVKLLAHLKATHSVDTDRIYVMGLSMGGFGTWDILMRHPDMFAAAVPMCGGADDSKAALISSIPIWNFHGGDDSVVKTIRSQHIVAALRQAGGTPRYTEYEHVGHNCWSPASQEPELLPWLFAQKRKGSPLCP